MALFGRGNHKLMPTRTIHKPSRSVQTPNNLKVIESSYGRKAPCTLVDKKHTSVEQS